MLSAQETMESRDELSEDAENVIDCLSPERNAISAKLRVHNRKKILIRISKFENELASKGKYSKNQTKVFHARYVEIIIFVQKHRYHA